VKQERQNFSSLRLPRITHVGLFLLRMLKVLDRSNTEFSGLNPARRAGHVDGYICCVIMNNSVSIVK
jgi:hypothetical protein